MTTISTTNWFCIAQVKNKLKATQMVVSMNDQCAFIGIKNTQSINIYNKFTTLNNKEHTSHETITYNKTLIVIPVKNTSKKN